ncbi:MAG: hypothetical protein GMKNLPBB_02830 [Myxococcota bacterium]|nr:hypothetical protein [Myxococcota bacterium]
MSRWITSCLFLLLMACGESSSSRPDGGAQPDGGAAADGAPDTAGGALNFPPAVEGVWAQLQVNGAINKLPFIGDVNARTSSVLKVALTRNGADLTVKSEVCSIVIDSGTKEIQTILTDAFVKSIRVPDKSARLEKTADGVLFIQPNVPEIRGARLENPLDPLPADPNDPRVIDQDGDGKPGLTVRLAGLVNGEVYVVQRANAALTGTVFSLDRMDGVIDWSEQQSIVGASDDLLKTPNESFPDKSSSFFRMTRITPDRTCAQLAAEQNTLFER